MSIAVQPLVPGFTITDAWGSNASGSTWSAVRRRDDRALVVRIVTVSDLSEAQALTTRLMAVLDQIGDEHLVRQHDFFALADGTLALVLEQVVGGGLDHLLGARGHLTPGETVTTVAPLFAVLAELHVAGVVHGRLAPDSVLFSADGRPLLSDIGVACLLAQQTGLVCGTTGFIAPELLGGAVPSPASDVYAMAAIGWFCLTGAPPAATAGRQSSNTVRPETPPRLVEVLAACLSTDPSARPSAHAAAIGVFDAAEARAVPLGSVADPAAEITRRIRAAAVPATTLTPPSPKARPRSALIIAVIALLVAAALGVGATWLVRLRPQAVHPVAVRPLAQPFRTPVTTTPSTVSKATPPTVTNVVTAPDSPRRDAAALLQALVDARALAYVARNPALLDLVFTPGAAKAASDRSNIATARKNGATYLGLAFAVKEVAFLEGSPGNARIRATIVTPAHETGQPDGRKVSHEQEIVGPSVFTLDLTPDGWRIRSLTS